MLEVELMKNNNFIRTYKADFIELQKLFLESDTPQKLIFGHLGAY